MNQTQNINSPNFFTQTEQINHAISIYSYFNESAGFASAALMDW